MTESFFADLPDDWSDSETALFYDFNNGIGFEVFNDPLVRSHFHDALFSIDRLSYDVRQQELENLKSYLSSRYGIDFDSNFDWDGWREWVTP